MLIYPSIFAFPSLSLHRRSTTTHLRSNVTACDCARMTIALTLSDQSCLFDGHMTYDSHVFTSILSISNVPPPVIRPITSSHTAQSGTFSNFALCSLSCFPFIFNLAVFTLRSEHHQRRATHLPIPVSPRIEIQHLRLTLSHTYFALFCITLHCHNTTVSTCHNTPGNNPLPPDHTPSESHRIYT